MFWTPIGSLRGYAARLTQELDQAVSGTEEARRNVESMRVQAQERIQEMAQNDRTGLLDGEFRKVSPPHAACARSSRSSTTLTCRPTCSR